MLDMIMLAWIVRLDVEDWYYKCSTMSVVFPMHGRQNLTRYPHLHLFRPVLPGFPPLVGLVGRVGLVGLVGLVGHAPLLDWYDRYDWYDW